MNKTKICSVKAGCGQRKSLEMFGESKDGLYGHKSVCKMCESKYHANRYKRKVAKKKPTLLSWQPKPGDKFEAYLGRNRCELNPFVCETNEDKAVIATSLDSRWTLDKSEYIFVRPN